MARFFKWLQSRFIYFHSTPVRPGVSARLAISYLRGLRARTCGRTSTCQCLPLHGRLTTRGCKKP